MKRKDNIEEVLENQNHILNAIENLNERLEAIEEIIDDDKIKYIKDILDSQTMIDEIIVKNSDHIALIQKAKEHSNHSFNAAIGKKIRGHPTKKLSKNFTP